MRVVKAREPHILTRELWVARPLDEVFEFFADAKNLAVITPPWLDFKIVTPAPIRMEVGTNILYRIRWHGLPMRWTTRITRWEPPMAFTDVQISGPYRLWQHSHRFAAERGGTRVTDEVRYTLPFGWLGLAVHAIAVKRSLRQIFDYRMARIAELFSGVQG